MSDAASVARAKILAAVRDVVRFQSTGDAAAVEGIFARGAIIVDSFAPYVFHDPMRWAAAFVQHVGDHDSLTARLLPPQEFSLSGDLAYVSQPVRWEFELGGQWMVELGALAAVARLCGRDWRLTHLSWGVSGIERVARGTIEASRIAARDEPPPLLHAPRADQDDPRED